MIIKRIPKTDRMRDISGGFRASEPAMLRLDDFTPEHSTLCVLGKGNKFRLIDPVHGFRHSCAVNMLTQGMSLFDSKNRLGHENIEPTKVYLHMDLRNKRKVQEKFFDYMQSTLKHAPELDDLIAWENKKETLDWLDTL